MSPPGRSTQMSPYDEHIEEERRALQAAKAASR